VDDPDARRAGAGTGQAVTTAGSSPRGGPRSRLRPVILVAVVTVAANATMRLVAAAAGTPRGLLAHLAELAAVLGPAGFLLFLAGFDRVVARAAGRRITGATRVLAIACGAAVAVAAAGLVLEPGSPAPAGDLTQALRGVVSLLLAFASLAFFTALCHDLDAEGGALGFTVRLAVAGALVSTVGHAAVFALFAVSLMRPDLVPIGAPAVRLTTAVVTALVSGTVLAFLVALYRDRRSRAGVCDPGPG